MPAGSGKKIMDNPEFNDKLTINPLDFFRPDVKRRPLTDLGSGGFITKYEVLLKFGAGQDEVEEALNRAGQLGLYTEFGGAVVETVVGLPRESRENMAVVARTLAGRAAEIEGRVQRRLVENNASAEDSEMLTGFGAVETMKVAANLMAQAPLMGTDELRQATRPLRWARQVNDQEREFHEIRVNWETVNKVAAIIDTERETDRQAGPAGKVGSGKPGWLEDVIKRAAPVILGIGIEQAGDLLEAVMKRITHEVKEGQGRPRATTQQPRPEPTRPEAAAAATPGEPLRRPEDTQPTRRPRPKQEEEEPGGTSGAGTKGEKGQPRRKIREERPASEEAMEKLIDRLGTALEKGGDGRAKAIATKEFFRMVREEITAAGGCGNCGAPRSLGETCSNCHSGSRVAGIMEENRFFQQLFGTPDGAVGGPGLPGGRGVPGGPEGRPGEAGVPGPEVHEQIGATADFFDERDFAAWGLNTQTVLQKRGQRAMTVSAVDLLNQYARSPRGLADKAEQMALMAVLSEKDRTSPDFSNGLIALIEVRKGHNGYFANYDGLAGHQRSILEGMSIKNMAEVIMGNEQAMKAMTVAWQLARAPSTPPPPGSLAAEIYAREGYKLVWEANEKVQQQAANGLLVQMKAELAQRLEVSRGAVEVAMTYAQAWGGRMGFSEMGEMAKKYPPYERAGYTRSFVDRAQVEMRDDRGRTFRGSLGGAYDSWRRMGLSPEQTTRNVMRTIRDFAPQATLTEMWTYFASAKEVLDEIERVYGGKQHQTHTIGEREVIVMGDGKTNKGLRDKWNGKWKIDSRVLGGVIGHLRTHQVVGASVPVTEARSPGLRGLGEAMRDSKEHTPGLGDVGLSWLEAGRVVWKRIKGEE